MADRGAAVRATLVYAHGGGLLTGDLDYSDELCRFLADGAGPPMSCSCHWGDPAAFAASDSSFLAVRIRTSIAVRTRAT